MKQRSNPSLIDILDEVKRDIFFSFNCHRVGILQSFNADEQTAEVILVDKRVISTYNGTELQDYGLLVSCPVLIVGGNSGWIDQPFTAGDNCLVLFNDRDLDNWFAQGVVSAPSTFRAHSLSDGIVIIGLHNALNKINSFDSTSLGFRYQDAKVGIKDGKARIENSSANLKILVDNLIDAIKVLQVVDPISGNLSITPATTAALNNIKTQFDSLLK